jgi:hypothetical protein
MGLIVGTQIGSGIFSSPGVVVAEVGSVGASLLVWVMSALLAWTGARSAPRSEQMLLKYSSSSQLIRRAGLRDTAVGRRSGLPRICREVLPYTIWETRSLSSLVR